jgi:regulator of sigma E protease
MTLVEILQFAVSLVAALFVFSVTIFVHELGHFLAARRKGLEVERFAIGFGPKIVSFTRKGVEYSINWIPFGGYVALPQMAPMEMIEGSNENEAQDLPPVSPWAKIVTAFWGPLFSFLLALFCAVILFFTGKNENTTVQTTMIGYVAPDSPASEVGILPGDRIVSIDGEPMVRWTGNGGGAVTQAVLLSVKKSVEVVIERNGLEETYVLEPLPNPDPAWEGLRWLGFEDPAYLARELVIARIVPGSPAEEAGLEAGDRILTMDGKTIFSHMQVKDLLKEYEGRTVSMEILRNDARQKITLVPIEEIETGKVMLGVGWEPASYDIVRVSPFQQVEESLVTMFQTLRALVSPDSHVGPKNMSGAVGILNTIRKLLIYDFRDFIYFCVFLNVNLAVLNMLPLPVLDGGHIVFSVIEWIRRKPVDVRILSGINTATFVALLAFMLYVTFFDVKRIHNSYEESQRLKEAPTFDDLKFSADDQGGEPQ